MRQLGTLYKSPISAGVVRWTQPGGPGTLVFPQQQPGEMIALFSFGCGHWFNNLEVVQESDGAGGEVAYLICPLCSYIQRAIDPAEDIYQFGDEPNAILIA
jgi:hypothetical protein